MVEVVRTPLSSIHKMAVYENSRKLSLREIVEEQQPDLAFTAVFYNPNSWEPVCPVKTNGKVLYQDENYDYWALAWEHGHDVAPALIPRGRSGSAANYVANCLLVRDGKPQSKLYYNKDVGGDRGRVAVALMKDDSMMVLGCQDGLDAMTPEEVRDLLAGTSAQFAILMDGGRKVNFYCRATGTMWEGKDPSHTLVLVWLNKAKEDDTMFKIALGAGHGINTAGKRCLKSIDPNETREWWLNDRICDYVESYLKSYEGYKLLRLDDSDDGKDNIALADRVKASNDFGADFYLSVHHNAGMNGGSGGGIIAYVHPAASDTSRKWQAALYDALIDHTGLKGNRSQPKAEGDYYVLKHTKMPAVLLELGFMDSKTDVPIILTNEYAQQCAKAIVEVIVERGKLTKKAEPEAGTLYKVQVGAFSKKENADKLLAELKAKGYQGYIVKV